MSSTTIRTMRDLKQFTIIGQNPASQYVPIAQTPIIKHPEMRPYRIVLIAREVGGQGEAELTVYDEIWNDYTVDMRQKISVLGVGHYKNGRYFKADEFDAALRCFAGRAHIQAVHCGSLFGR